MGVIAATIKEKLTNAFNPSHLEVIDESHKHAHHRGAAEHRADGGSAESHFHVVITAKTFKGLSRLARHRAVMDVLTDEMDGKVHALSLIANTDD